MHGARCARTSLPFDPMRSRSDRAAILDAWIERTDLGALDYQQVAARAL